MTETIRAPIVGREHSGTYFTVDRELVDNSRELTTTEFPPFCKFLSGLGIKKFFFFSTILIFEPPSPRLR